MRGRSNGARAQSALRFPVKACLFVISSLVVRHADAQVQPSGAALSPASSQNGPGAQITPLAAFGKIALCVPFTTAVQPSAGYQITISAQPEVTKSINATVNNGTLGLVVSAVNATDPIRVTIGLPPTALSSLSTNGVGSVILFPGFSSPELTISAAGTGSVYASGINVTTAQITNTGTNSVVVSGGIGSVSIKASGTGATSVAGLMDSATVSASGTGSINLQTTNGTAAISGTSQGLAKVYYSAGVCSMQGSTPNSPFGPPCQKRDYVPPDTSAFWTCGVNITGTASCNGGYGSTVSTGSAQCPAVQVAPAMAPVASMAGQK